MMTTKPPEFRYLNTLSNTREYDRGKCRDLRFMVLCVCIFGLLAVFATNIFSFMEGNWKNTFLTSISDCDSHFASPKCVNNIPRLLSYCSKKIHGGDEGNFVGDENWRLIRVVVIVRHGDRSSITSKNGFYNKNFTGQSYFQPSALNYIPKTGIFNINKLSGNGTSYPLPSSYTFSLPDKDLPPGILTTTGFMQHIEQGKWLRNVYFEHIHGITSVANSIYIRSTNYQRTIMSAVALLLGMLPDHLTKNKLKKILINVNELDGHEVMLGVTSHPIQSGKRCSSELHWRKQQQATLIPPQSQSYQLLAQEFQIKNKNLSTTGLADIFLPSYCHDLLPLCSSNNNNSDASNSNSNSISTNTPLPFCIPGDALSELMMESDKEYCDLYSGKDGGYNSSALRMYPFLLEITTILKEAITSTASSRTASPSPFFWIYSAHDTVLASILAALRIFPSDCKWPKYASRLVVELWAPTSAAKENSSSTTRSSRHRRLAGSGTSDRGGGPITISNTMFRILYNGKSVTELLPRCAEASLGMDSSNTIGLCPLSLLLEEVHSALNGYQTFAEACDLKI